MNAGFKPSQSSMEVLALPNEIEDGETKLTEEVEEEMKRRYVINAKRGLNVRKVRKVRKEKIYTKDNLPNKISKKERKS